MPKIVCTAPLPASLVSALVQTALAQRGTKLEDLEVVSLQTRTKDELIELVSDADVVIGDYTFQVPIDSDVVAAMERCRLIQQPSAGYQQIDVEAAKSKGIPVANAGGANDVAVAEYTVMVGLALLRSLFWADRHTRAGEWPQMAISQVGCVELQGKTWGIVGLGRIGKEVARRLRPFGCKQLYHDVIRAPRDVEEELGVSYCELERLLETSDIVSLHVPLTPQTHHLIGERELKLLGRSGFLINVARGEVVDEKALVEALKEKKIKGAAIDVFEVEPPPADHPLFSLDNVIVTSHVAGVTDEARRRIMQLTTENVARVLAGESPLNVVN